MSQAGINHTLVSLPGAPHSVDMMNETFMIGGDEAIISAWDDYRAIFTAINRTDGEMADAMTRHLCRLSHRIEDATPSTVLGVLVKAKIAFMNQREDAETERAVVAGTFARDDIASDHPEDLVLWSLIENLEAVVAGTGRA